MTLLLEDDDEYDDDEEEDDDVALAHFTSASDSPARVPFESDAEAVIVGAAVLTMALMSAADGKKLTCQS